MVAREVVVFAVAILVPALGVFSVAMARLRERSRHQAFWQRVFVVCFLFVGGMSMLAICAGLRCSFLPAATLPIMALGATLDLRRTSHCSAF